MLPSFGRLRKQVVSISCKSHLYQLSISEYDLHLLINFLLNTLFVPTKNNPSVSCPQTILGDPSIFAVKLLEFSSNSSADKLPSSTVSSRCSMCNSGIIKERIVVNKVEKKRGNVMPPPGNLCLIVSSHPRKIQFDCYN